MTAPASEWRSEAACHGTDTDKWFPATTKSARRRAAELDRQYCNGCPVRGACIRDAIAHGDTAGIRAGVFLGLGTQNADRREAAATMLRNRLYAPPPVPKCPRGHLITGPNLVPAALRQGKHACLACSRARSYLSKGQHPDLVFEVEADRYYQQIRKAAA